MIDSKSALPDFLPFQPNEFIIPDSAVVGDVLVLTKPLGTQVLHNNNFSKKNIQSSQSPPQLEVISILVSTSMRPGGVERAPVVGPAGEVEQDQAGGEMFHILYFWLLNGERFYMQIVDMTKHISWELDLFGGFIRKPMCEKNS